MYRQGQNSTCSTFTRFKYKRLRHATPIRKKNHRREITALFCDPRGFTGFTESAEAEDVMALLRDYHAAIGELIIKYNGAPAVAMA